MNYFVDPLLKISEYNDLLGYMRSYSGAVSVIGPSDSQKVHLIYSLCTHSDAKCIYIMICRPERHLKTSVSFMARKVFCTFPQKK
jgi:hypothetical protein